MTSLAPRQLARRTQSGFTLVEILVALLISSIGLLGLAGMQALALVSTQVASVRSLVALQASSLAAAMHSNPGYWTAPTSSSGFNMSGVNVIDNNSNQLGQTGVNCEFSAPPTSGQCDPLHLAIFDVHAWAANMNSLLPTYSAVVACSTNPSVPRSCRLDISWTERYVAMGRTAQADSSATGGLRKYTLYIEP